MKTCDTVFGLEWFYINFTILSKTCEKVFGLEWFLDEFQYFKQDVWDSVWFRLVFTPISIF